MSLLELVLSILAVGAAYTFAMARFAVSKNDETEPRKHLALKITGYILCAFGIFSAISALIHCMEIPSGDVTQMSPYLKQQIDLSLGGGLFGGCFLAGIGVFCIRYKWTKRPVLAKIGIWVIQIIFFRVINVMIDSAIGRDIPGYWISLVGLLMFSFTIGNRCEEITNKNVPLWKRHSTIKQNMKMAHHCPNCGQRLSGSEGNFCKNCGAQLK